MPDGEVEVTVAAAEKNQQVARVINALSELEKSSPEVLSFKTEEGIQLIKIKDIIYIDVSENDLLIYTKQELMVTKGRLSKVLERIKNTNFVQVSKHAAVNINHLDRLENSFSGSMLAKLSQGNETMVSRRYVKKLIEHLGV
ncbi:LytTr DNA-binding domain-containing protein [Fructobacillus durionis]|uniref:LytTr DNA-binding domain-containing protein n=2 Tax=Fructobacillus durionis TaxID=283737 RepID=A0A1I1G2N6_9LACO|nr:LytTr DNA-binding domain-containing protein [Fructobacillus durionis]